MTIRIINEKYDNKMHHDLTHEYYGRSDFFNFGYWVANTHCQREACENLMERLLAFIPKKKGAILDVGRTLRAVHSCRWMLLNWGLTIVSLTALSVSRQPSTLITVKNSSGRLTVC